MITGDPMCACGCGGYLGQCRGPQVKPSSTTWKVPMTDPTEKRPNPYWLIERRDMQSQPAWLIVNGFRLSWTFTAIHASRFVSEEEAAIARSDFREQMPDETWITEHLDV